ncbi:hypothetical protein ZWY2020_033779 [Hordeum vulgare]|nr:hypothetical protein ZWY2020_033779 [Hordeum vulgare]
MAAVLPLYLLVVLLLAIPFLFFKSRCSAPRRGAGDRAGPLLPGAWALPVIGHLAGALPQRGPVDLAQRHGPPMMLRLSELDDVVVSSPDVTREIMKTHDASFASRPLTSMQQMAYGDAEDVIFAATRGGSFARYAPSRSSAPAASSPSTPLVRRSSAKPSAPWWQRRRPRLRRSTGPSAYRHSSWTPRCVQRRRNAASGVSGRRRRDAAKKANATQALVLVDRSNLGISGAALVRYPENPYDHVWIPWSEIDSNEWAEISTPEKVKELADLRFNAPSAVMQTAIAPRNGSRSASSRTIQLSWDAAPNHAYPDPEVIGIVYFAEVEVVAGGAARQFEMAINGKLWSKAPFTPQHLICDAFFNSEAHRGFGGHYNITLKATANSTLLPTINAAEFFSVVSTANVATDTKDVVAMAAIKAKYEVKKNWAGDPCTPKTLVWEGLNCSYAMSMPPRITRLNISFGGLRGSIQSHFANLKAIKYLDLSYNNFTGSIPNALSELPFLVPDLTGNQLNGSIPSGLMKRIQDGSLTLRYGKNPNLCSNGSSCEPTKKKSKLMLAVYIVVPILAVVVIGALAMLLLLILRKKQGSRKGSVKPQNEASGVHLQWRNGDTHSMLQLDHRRCTYKDLQVMTNNFKTVLGRGGFGSVYDGFLADGTQVAVKLRSESSSQGIIEFLTEAQTLTKIHHKNLVSMVGYCKDGEYMALVYEHMSEGNLEDKLRGQSGHTSGINSA